MTDYTLSDEIAAELASVAPEVAGAFHADVYSLVRLTSVTDSRGGETETETVVESGRCRLTVSQRMGGERTSGGIVVTPVSLYTVELPKGSLVTEDDTLVINGRTFAVTDTKTGGGIGLFTTVEVEER